MKNRFFMSCIVVFAAVMTSCSQGNPVLKISGGKVQGVPSDSAGVLVYKGIPYAAQPVGDLRWKKPQPVQPWDTVMIADHFGRIAMQDALDPSSFYVKEFYSDGLPEMGEDCLYLNVWAPAKTVGNIDSKLPVAMWIHGGAFDHGWGNEITMDGDAWASKGVIMVTINYRVGIFGFFSHPALSAEDGGVSGNYGIYDQIAALKWIRENISQFGGDPANITILGQSAGGMSVRTLVSSPASKDLMAKAIIQSGGGVSDTNMPLPAQELFDSIGTAFSEYAKCNDINDLRKLSADRLLALGDEFLGYMNHSVRFSPHTAGDIVTDFSGAVRNGTVADVPYMIGCTSGDIAGLGGRPIETFCSLRDSLSDMPVYDYLFERNLPGDDDDPATDPGAFHSSELWFMFGTLKNAWRPFTKADYVLSERMVDYWTNFAKYGDPNGDQPGDWQPYTKDNHFVMKLKIE